MSGDLDSGRIRYPGFGGLGMQSILVDRACENVSIPIVHIPSD